MVRLTFVTSNANKLAAARAHLAPLGIEVDHVAMELDEIQATTVEAVARHKAAQAFGALGRPVVVEDAGFWIDELNFPGPLVKHVVAMMGADGLARLADLTRDRRCHFESVLVYLPDPDHPVVVHDRASVGTVAERAHHDPAAAAWSAIWDVYIPAGFDRPASALGDQENWLRLERWGERSAYRQLGELLIAPGRS